jgi:hypothetical protein
LCEQHAATSYNWRSRERSAGMPPPQDMQKVYRVSYKSVKRELNLQAIWGLLRLYSVVR